MPISQSVDIDNISASVVAGEGVAGTPTGGVVTVQGPTTGGVLLTKDAASGIDGSTAPTDTIQVGGKDSSGNLQTLLVDSFGIQYQHIADLNGSNVAKVSTNGDIYTRDVIQTAIQSRAQSITTTAAAAMGGASVLTNRKFISLTPTNGTIYYGATAAVTTTSGIPIFANQTAVLAFGDSFNVFVIAAATTDCRIMEGS